MVYQETYLILGLKLDILIVVQVDGIRVGGVDDVGKSTLVDKLTVVGTAISGQKDSLTLGIVTSDVTDDTGEAVHGMGTLDVPGSGIGAVLDRHGCSVGLINGARRGLVNVLRASRGYLAAFDDGRALFCEGLVKTSRRSSYIPGHDI